MKHKEIFKHLTLKDKIRLFVFPKIATILNKFGFDWSALGETKLSTVNLISQGKYLSKTLGLIENNNNSLEIIFVTMLGGHPHNLSFEILLAFGLKKKGHNVRFIIDDCTLPITEDHTLGKEKSFKNISAWSYHYGLNYVKSCGFEVIALSSLHNEDIVFNMNKYTHIIEASLLKHFKVGILFDDLPLLQEKRKMCEESIIITDQVGKEIVKINPDRVIMSHGIYSTWGPIFDNINEAGIPVLTYGRGKKANTKKFNWNMTSDWWDVSEEWEKIKDVKLSERQNNKIDKYLESRVSHKDDVLIYNFGELEEREKTIKRFSLNPDKPIFSLFTNVLWDAASAQREITFSNPVTWVIETIDWFKNNPDKQLIIKIHPAEKVIGTNQPFMSLLKQHYIEIPSNIRIIEPHEKVNSWSIYNVTDIGIVHTTTVGMELPLLGIPCIVVSSTHFRNKGFTIDINNKYDYFDFLTSYKRGQVELTEEQIDLAKKYAYLLFERYQIPLPFFNESTPLMTTSLKVQSIEELLDQSNYRLVLSCIENKQNILLDEE